MSEHSVDTEGDHLAVAYDNGLEILKSRFVLDSSTCQPGNVE